MIRYRVIVAPDAEWQIGRCAVYIAEASGDRGVAEAWSNRVYQSIQQLSYFPKRFELATEDASRDYEIRRLIIGAYIALYTVDEEVKTVSILHFRHGSRLPRPGELP